MNSFIILTKHKSDKLQWHRGQAFMVTVSAEAANLLKQTDKGTENTLNNKASWRSWGSQGEGQPGEEVGKKKETRKEKGKKSRDPHQG